MSSAGPASVVTNLLVGLESSLGSIDVWTCKQVLVRKAEVQPWDALINARISSGGIIDQVVELLIASTERVRETTGSKVDTAGIITTVAGSGSAGGDVENVNRRYQHRPGGETIGTHGEQEDCAVIAHQKASDRDDCR